MKIKSWGKYFIYSLLIFSFSLVGQYVFKTIKINNDKTFNYNPYLNDILMIVFYGGIGILLGLEHFIKEISKKGIWKLNLPKLVLIGVPSLYFSVFIFIYYSNIPFISQYLSYNWLIFSQGNTSYIAIFQVILGYIIVTSFYKVNED